LFLKCGDWEREQSKAFARLPNRGDDVRRALGGLVHMAKILLQTTIAAAGDDCPVSRFTRLAELLRSDGHEVVCRDREPLDDGSDAVLPNLPESAFEQLWLIAADTGNGLAPADVRGILRFRERGGGVLTARGEKNRGASLLNLGAIGTVNNFHTYNRERGRRTARHSGKTGDYQRIEPAQPVHELLHTEKSPSGVVQFFPAHPHEGALSVPDNMPYARVIATSAPNHNRAFNLAVAVENEPTGNGHPCGRAIAISSLHHLSDANWVKLEQRDEPERFDAFKDYLRNIARWLSP
jgi:hypothetical protein